jgi:hypothetical protein
LLKNEQLGIEMQKGHVFHGFREGKIKFPPTFKFDTKSSVIIQALPFGIQSPDAPKSASSGSTPTSATSRLVADVDGYADGYDSSAKQRIPSWTDRILFKSKSNANQLLLERYDAAMTMTSSDHKPVFAEFRLLPGDATRPVTALHKHRRRFCLVWS